MQRARGALSLGVGLIATAVACKGPTPERPPQATQARMTEIVRALRVALPLALHVEDFRAPENQPALEQALASLERSASALDQHGGSRDVGFAHLSHSLALDAAEIQRRFQSGRREEARFLLTELVDHCVACHSRFPGPTRSALGRRLYEAVDTSRLSPGQRVRMLVATRQFDQALSELEALLEADDEDPRRLDASGLLDDYLTLAVRMEGDLERARQHLADWRAGHELPAYLDDLAGAWIESLRQLSGHPPRGAPLEVAREVARQAAALRRFPADRRARVHDLVVSSLLHRALASSFLGAEGTAEAYYLIGVSELHSGPSDWLLAPEAYLEAAIRAAPRSRFAREAYLVLEEETLAGYSGSSGTHLPPAVESWLAELRDLAGL